MHTYEEYRQILELWEVGFKKKRISIMIGINRATVRECIARYETVEGLEKEARFIKHRDGPEELRLLKLGASDESPELFQAYAYLLGLYLGDGMLTKNPGTYKLRIVLDPGYPNIIISCMDSIRAVVPGNKVNTVKKFGNCVEVYCFNSFWPDFFPQHGPGPEHERPIIVDDWQQRIVETFPMEFFRGLIHSDGSQSHNVINGKDYPRCELSNYSDDIRGLFSQTCDRLVVRWRTASGAAASRSCAARTSSASISTSGQGRDHLPMTRRWQSLFLILGTSQYNIWQAKLPPLHTIDSKR